MDTAWGMSFQAAELIKFALLIWLAGFLADRIRNHEIQDTSKIQKPLFIVLGLIAFIVAFIQSDLGSSAVMVAMIAAMVFIAGAPKAYISDGYRYYYRCSSINIY